MRLDTAGGQGTILRALWNFDDGTHDEGTTVSAHDHGSVTITDGAGNTVTASF